MILSCQTQNAFDARTLCSRTPPRRLFALALPLIFLTLASCNSRPEAATASSADVNSNVVSIVTNDGENSKSDFSARPKIIAYGDSLTAGYGLSADESYPALLQAKLDAAGYQYEVINAGVSGDTSLQGLSRLHWTLGDRDDSREVRIMILELGANDILRGKSVAEMRDNLSKIIKEAQERNIKVLLCGMLSPTNTGQAYQAQVVEAYQSLAREHNVPLLPFFLEGVALNPELNLADGAHPNARGTHIIAETVFKHLKPILDEEQSARNSSGRS